METRDQLLEFLRMAFQTDHEQILDAISDIARMIAVPKGTSLFRAGDCTDKVFLLYDGIVRQYYLDENGDEITEWLPNCPGSVIYSSYKLKREDHAKVSCDTVTDCRLVRFRAADLLELSERIPEFQQIRLRKLQETLERQARLKRIMEHRTPSERYAWLLENRPWIVEKVPHKYTASFLVMTPVSLSRIRSRYKQKDA